MKEITIYYAEGSNYPYYKKEDAEKAERDFLERQKLWRSESAEAKLDKLKHQLDECMHVWEGTIATCSFDSIRVKGMVKVCQDFIEKNKHYLNYY